MALQPLIPDPSQPDFSGMPNPVPQLSAGLKPLVVPPRIQQENDLQSKISQYENPQQKTGFWQRVGHIAAQIGNAAGDIVAPGTMALIPGTQLHNDILHSQRLNELAGLQRQDESESNAASENALRGAQTGHLTEETAEMPGSEASKQALEAAQTNKANQPDLAQAYAHAVSDAIKRGGDPSSDPIVQHLADAITNIQKQPAPKGAEHINVVGPDGKPMIASYDPTTKKTYDSSGKEIVNPQPYEKPNVTNINAENNHLFAEQERGRGLLDSAEKQYRTAQQGANTMRDMLTSADAGNKMSGQMLPLEGALAITTAQGVHRINRTEVDQFAGGGSLYDKIAGEMGKLTAGQPMDAQLRSDIRKLTDLQEKSAYQNYKDAHASATRRYKLTDEQPLPEPGGGAGGVQTFTDGDKQYQIPPEHVAEFKKDHPNAR